MNVASSLFKSQTSRSKSLIKLCEVSVRRRQTFKKINLERWRQQLQKPKKPIEHSA